LPEAADIYTGEIIPLQLTATQLASYRRVRVDGKTRWVPLDELAVPIKYSPLLAEEICAGLLEGHGIMATLKAVGMSYREYCNMRRVYPDFAEMVEQARRDRAELFFDKLEEVAETTPAVEEDIALGRLKADVYKHMAEVSSPERFGKKTQIQGKIGIGIIKVDTGIDRGSGSTDAEFSHIAEKQAEIAAAEVVSVAVQMPTNLPKKSEEL
jgi:hypothetical protein